MIFVGDCVEQMRRFPDAHFSAVVCDPPYALEFMGAAWDRVGKTPRDFQEWCETWAREALRVLKPGGHLLAFGGTRTYHRLACGLEDAGFEIRDSMLYWGYGSGFPKSFNVAKGIDLKLGAEGAWVREEHPGRPGARAGRRPESGPAIGQQKHASDENPEGLRHVYEPATDEARAWNGWGTALKPAYEPIVVARKPLAGGVPATVLEHGTGALNVKACEVGTDAGWSYPNGRGGSGWHGRESLETNLDVPMRASGGRWPANVILSHTPDCVVVGEKTVQSNGHYPSARGAGGLGTAGHGGQAGLEERATRGETVEVWECAPGCAVLELDDAVGELRSGRLEPHHRRRTARLGQNTYGAEKSSGLATSGGSYGGDSGGPSRFFYCAKVGRAEREAGVPDWIAAGELNWSSGDENPGAFQSEGTDRSARNDHPTVKPIEVMRWLLRLVTPPGGRVLDPFMGSGTTLCAGAIEGIDVVGIEQSQRFALIAWHRRAFWAEHGEEGLEVMRRQAQAERRRAEVAETGQLDLLSAT